MDVVAAYRSTRERITAVVGDAGPAAAFQTVPACPRWQVRDVVAHLAGVCDDILAGNIAAAGTDPWTEAQVVKRRDRALAELLDEWAELGPKVEEALGVHMPEQLVFDEVTHEHDLRGALGPAGDRRGDPLEVALNFAVEGMDGSVRTHGLPALRICSDGQERTIGEGEAAATLTASSFDLLRSFTGRRSTGQVLALDWGDGEGTRWLPAFAYGPFVLRTDDGV